MLLPEELGQEPESQDLNAQELNAQDLDALRAAVQALERPSLALG